MIAQRALLTAQTFQEPGERHIGRYPRPQRKRVNEKAGHFIRAGHFKMPARPHNAKDHVLLAAVSRQKKGPCRLDERIKRNAPRSGSRGQGGGGGAGECKRVFVVCRPRGAGSDAGICS